MRLFEALNVVYISEFDYVECERKFFSYMPINFYFSVTYKALLI